MPNRILKESIRTSDSIDSLSWFEEVLFYRLMVSCDDYGRFDGRPAIIKNCLFPLKENLTIKAVSAAINTLASNGLVSLYEFEGKPYLYLPTWNEHQNVRAKKSKYPSPDEGVKTSASKCMQMQSDENICPRNPIQSESNAISESNASIAPTPVKNVPTLEQVEEYAKLRRSSADPKRFYEYYATAGWRDAEGKPVYNWKQKFVLWEMREQEKQKRQEKKQTWKPGGSHERKAEPEKPGEDMDRLRKYLQQQKEATND